MQEEQLTPIREELQEIRLLLGRHAEFIESEITARNARIDFWREVRTQVVVNGIRGVFIALAWVSWYAFTQYTHPHGQ